MFVDVTGLLSGGGGGSRTRVRRYVPTGLYMRVHACFFTTRVRAWQKPREAKRRRILPRPVNAADRGQPVK